VLWAVFALLGFTAVVAQVFLMRELMVVFYGNEISLGLMLGSWLLWAAFGSGVLGRRKPDNPRRLAALLETGLAFAFPLGILLARSSRLAFQTVPGEMLGPGAMLAASLAALGLFCTLSGWLFAVAGRLPAMDAARASSTVYMAEAAGSAIGGLLASIVLVRTLTPMQTAALVGALNLLAAALLAGWRWRAAFAAAALLAAAPKLEQLSLSWLWHGFEVVESHNSAYGNLVVTRTGGSRTLYENGLAMATSPDPAAAEESVHYALLEHPGPRTVLMIGGGINGSIDQALLHPSVERIDYVELDPAIIDLARRHFPLPDNPRVHIHEVDGRLYLKQSSSQYDVILLNLPEPQTALINRFYTLEFFREAAAKLTPGGVLSFALPASENYISPDQAGLLQCIRHTLGEVFLDVAVMPGDTVHFFASTRQGSLVRDADALLKHKREREIPSVYVSEALLPFRMTETRVRDLENLLSPTPDTPVNRDFAPVAYYYDMVLWSARVARGARPWLRSLAAIPFAAVAAFAALLVAALAFLFRRRPAGIAVASMGFVSLGLEVVLLLAFEAVHGYVYQQLALLVACFMAGMALGSSAAIRRGGAWRSLVIVQALGAATPLVAIPVAAQGQAAILLLGLWCGALAGYQFPIASQAAHTRSTGALYGFDLAGACLAALTLSACVIPIYGLFRASMLLAVINAIPAVTLALSLRRPTP